MAVISNSRGHRSLWASLVSASALLLCSISAQAQPPIQPADRPAADADQNSDSLERADESHVGTAMGLATSSEMTQSSCVAVFGDRDQMAQNGEWREGMLYGFDVNDEGWTIIHRVAEWRKPKDARFADMTVVRTQKLGDEEIAVVSFAGKWAERCGEEHILKQDMSLGPHTQVLSIADGVVLLDRDGELQTWTPEDAPRPARTQMVWRSDYSILLSSGGGASARKNPKAKESKKAASSAAKRRAKARKNKKKKKK